MKPQVPNRIEAARAALGVMYQLGRRNLGSYWWESEHDRWAELCACLLTEGVGLQPGQARQIVRHLLQIGLMAPSELAKADQIERRLLRRAVLRGGTDATDANKAADLLIQLSKAVVSEWAGYVQRFLRIHGETMTGQLSKTLTKFGIDEAAAARTVTLWLQNAACLPILLADSPHVRAFCEKTGVSAQGLVEAADEIGLNVALIDDLLLLNTRANRLPIDSVRRVRSRRKKS